jgi:transposase
MEHIGVDLGGRESQVCIRDSQGKILEETRQLTRELGTYLGRRPASRVVMETCAEAFRVADAAKLAGHEANVVPSTLVRALGVGARGIKTDVRDARLQSELSCRMKELPKVHVPSLAARELKTLLNMRDAMVSARTQMSNTVRGYLRGQLLRVRCTSETMPKRIRALLLEQPPGIPMYLERQLVVLETLNAQLQAADKEIERLAETHPVCKLLMTAPAVGPITAARFVSSVDEVGRFPKAHALESYLGVTPGESSSSERQRRTGLTKAGPSAVRKCLAQVCWVIYRLRPQDPLSCWGRQIAERRSKQVAICAMMRKLAGILFAMWRDQRAYDPGRLEPPV